MITAKTAREMSDKALEDRMMESQKRIEGEIRKAAAKGESAAYIDWPISQELIAELRGNGNRGQENAKIRQGKEAEFPGRCASAPFHT